MISDNSKVELKHKIEEVEARISILNGEIVKHQEAIDFAKSRKQDLKSILDDLKADCT